MCKRYSACHNCELAPRGTTIPTVFNILFFFRPVQCETRTRLWGHSPLCYVPSSMTSVSSLCGLSLAVRVCSVGSRQQRPRATAAEAPRAHGAPYGTQASSPLATVRQSWAIYVRRHVWWTQAGRGHAVRSFDVADQTTLDSCVVGSAPYDWGFAWFICCQACRRASESIHDVRWNAPCPPAASRVTKRRRAPSRLHTLALLT